MVENTAGIGNALAEGTQARPYSGTPITSAVKFGIQNEIKRQAAEAAAQAKRQKDLEQLDKKIVVDTAKVGSRWLPRIQDYTKQAIRGAYDAQSKGDNQSLTEILSSVKLMNDTHELMSASENDVLKNRGTIRPRFVNDILTSTSNEQDNQAAQGYDPLIHDFVKVTDTPLGGKTFQYNYYPKDIDLNQSAQKELANLQNGNELSLVPSKFQNYYGTKNELSPIERQDVAKKLVDYSEDWNGKISTQYEPQIRQIRQQLIDNKQAKDMDDATLKAKYIVSNKIIEDNYHTIFGTKGQPQQKPYSSGTQTQQRAIDISSGTPYTTFGEVDPVFKTMTGSATLVKLPTNAKSVEFTDAQGNRIEGYPKQLIVMPDGSYRLTVASKKITASNIKADIGGVTIDKIVPLDRNNYISIKSSTGLSEPKAFEQAVNDKFGEYNYNIKFDETPFVKAEGANASQNPTWAAAHKEKKSKEKKK
jgi:hypothetical protein